MGSFVLNTIGSKLAVLGLGALCLMVFVAGVSHDSYKKGYAECDKKFSAYKQTQLELVHELETKYYEQEKEYQTKTQDLVQQVAESKEKYTQQLMSVERSYANRLLESEQRANLYKQMSSSSSSSKVNLADYTAKLDRVIVEGRQLVAELKATIELRDEQLKQCGEQLKLMENAYARPDAE